MNTQDSNNITPDGLMRISKETKSETIRIQQFILEKKGVALNEILIEVEYQTSSMAIAAMMKGLNEFYFKPAGMSAPEDTIQQTEHNLKVWNDINQQAKKKEPSLFLP